MKNRFHFFVLFFAALAMGTNGLSASNKKKKKNIFKTLIPKFKLFKSKSNKKKNLLLEQISEKVIGKEEKEKIDQNLNNNIDDQKINPSPSITDYLEEPSNGQIYPTSIKDHLSNTEKPKPVQLNKIYKEEENGEEGVNKALQAHFAKEEMSANVYKED